MIRYDVRGKRDQAEENGITAEFDRDLVIFLVIYKLRIR